MDYDHPIIDPKTLPTWTAAGFVLALLALVTAFVGVYRANNIAVMTQAEVLALSKRINDTSRAPSAPVVVTPDAAPQK